MSRTPLLFGAALALALPAAGARAADIPSSTTLKGQLRLLFKVWDRNDDGYLDREELARAFRGPKAKPYEPPPRAKTDDKTEPARDADKDRPARPEFLKYPDYVFLIELDANGDGKISRKEFETWARSYAVEVHHRLTEEARLEKSLVGKTEAELRQAQAEARKAEQRLKAFEKPILEELKQQNWR